MRCLMTQPLQLCSCCIHRHGVCCLSRGAELENMRLDGSRSSGPSLAKSSATQSSWHHLVEALRLGPCIIWSLRCPCRKSCVIIKQERQFKPVYRLVAAAMSARSTSAASGMQRVCTASVCRRPSASGGGTYSSRSKRPGLRSAASTAAGLFVAASTSTPAAGCILWQKVTWHGQRAGTPSCSLVELLEIKALL